MTSNILITGGAGYIGSHTAIALLEVGHKVTVIDNYSNSSEASIKKIEQITERHFKTHQFDITHREALLSVFNQIKPNLVIHFAGKKSVLESIEYPDYYYEQNVGGTQNLLAAMQASGCDKLVFSSSATIYGVPEILPITEAHRLAPVNPYGKSKQLSEEIISDWAARLDRRSAAVLRYFNPVGAHISGEIGENPKGRPSNLFPFISQVAVGKRACLEIFGEDYDTHDGTGVRDYIHISDLVDGHLAAARYVQENNGAHIFNLGTGKGYSVKEIVQAFERASGQIIPTKIMPRRAGDVAACFADTQKAAKELGWTAHRQLVDMVEDSWRWQQNHPDGF